MKRTALILSVVFCLIFLSTAAFAGDQNVEKSFGQTVYVPAAWNNSDYGDYTQTITTGLIIRNIDPHKQIKVNKVEFYGPDLLFPDNSPLMYRDFLDGPGVEISSWRSISYRTFASGVDPFGQGLDRPFFIVGWEANGRVIPPIITSSIGVINLDDPYGYFRAFTIISGKVIKEK